ncbi:hypothetical protein [Dielma fastidiosa]|uniref:hypothetical protein n=1 Tax=Dielma fastidiosa TaxID=1034346 RepID=UPI000E5537DC|nr:hypothetical protein [Dielma fastidiosa]RHN00315.1 hypothetical protein DWZ33_11030 [Dielma fastidiosa]
MKKLLTKIMITGFAFLAVSGMQVNAARQSGSTATSNLFEGSVSYNYGVLSSGVKCEEAGGYSIINWEEDDKTPKIFKLWFKVAGNGSSQSICVKHHDNFSFSSGTVTGKYYTLSGAREYPIDPSTFVKGSWQV